MRLLSLIGLIWRAIFSLVRDAAQFAYLYLKDDLAPHNPYKPSEHVPMGVVTPLNPSKPVLFRCDTCHELFWDTSPQDVQRRHAGHMYRHAVNATWREVVACKMGRIR